MNDMITRLLTPYYLLEQDERYATLDLDRNVLEDHYTINRQINMEQLQILYNKLSFTFMSNLNQRVFGSAENALVNASLKCQGFMKVGEVLHLQGPHISEETLAEAISRLQRRHPFLRSRLQQNPAEPDTYLAEEDNTLRLKIREIPRKCEDHLNFWRQEWRQREKDIPVIGQGFAEFWLLQDPDDSANENGPREIVIVCEHSICDGLSLSTVAHELLAALADEDRDIFDNSLNWPVTMESAIQASIAASNISITPPEATTRIMAKLPLGSVDFPLTDMAEHCHTEIFYSSLNKDETQKLIEKCREQNVTITSAVSSASLCTIFDLVGNDSDTDPMTQLALSLVADTRKRCIPPIPNHDLSYHVSAIMLFTVPIKDAPTTTEGMWQVAKSFVDHVKTSIDAGQIFFLGMIMGLLYQRNMGPPNLAEIPSCGISSWGVLPFREQYGKWKFTTMTPCVNFIRAPLPSAFVQTANGILKISYVGAAPLILPSTLESLCNGTMCKLRQMIED